MSETLNRRPPLPPEIVLEIATFLGRNDGKILLILRSLSKATMRWFDTEGVTDISCEFTAVDFSHLSAPARYVPHLFLYRKVYSRLPLGAKLSVLLPNLRGIYLQGFFDLENEHFSQLLSGMSKLRQLSLNGAFRGLTWEVFQHSEPVVSKLEMLSLTHCKNLDSRILSFCGSLRKLEVDDLQEFGWDSDGFRSLKNLEKLVLSSVNLGFKNQKLGEPDQQTGDDDGLEPLPLWFSDDVTIPIPKGALAECSPRLEVLIVRSCSGLKGTSFQGLTQRCERLCKVQVSDCLGMHDESSFRQESGFDTDPWSGILDFTAWCPIMIGGGIGFGVMKSLELSRRLVED